jgi:hypothetical protein
MGEQLGVAAARAGHEHVGKPVVVIVGPDRRHADAVS